LNKFIKWFDFSLFYFFLLSHKWLHKYLLNSIVISLICHIFRRKREKQLLWIRRKKHFYSQLLLTSCILNMQVLALLGRCHSLRLHTPQLKNNNNNNNTVQTIIKSSQMLHREIVWGCRDNGRSGAGANPKMNPSVTRLIHEISLPLLRRC
jgi:hypothetical protein